MAGKSKAKDKITKPRFIVQVCYECSYRDVFAEEFKSSCPNCEKQHWAIYNEPKDGPLPTIPDIEIKKDNIGGENHGG